MAESFSLMDELPEEDKHPPNLGFECEVLEVAFHPIEQIVAVGLVTGHVELFKYSDEGNLCMAQLTHHKKSCRALTFSDAGSVLFTGSSDKSLQAVDLATCSVFYKEKKAHDDPINSLVRVNETVLATGDDGGVVKIWDQRKGACARSYEDNQTDFVSDMTYLPEQNSLLVTSGDGTLAVYDLRQNKPVAVTEPLDDELLSVAVMKKQTKVICGSQSGVLNVFSWGEWGDVSDRFLGHPSSIDTLVPIDDQILLSGSSDGIIRVLTMFPNEFLGVVGEHADFPIERIRISPSHRYLASCSHDNTVKFWNVEYLYEEDDEPQDADEMANGDAENAMDAADETTAMDIDGMVESTGSSSRPRGGRPKKKAKATSTSDTNFFADL